MSVLFCKIKTNKLIKVCKITRFIHQFLKEVVKLICYPVERKVHLAAYAAHFVR